MKKTSLFNLIFLSLILISLSLVCTIFFILNQRFQHDEKILLTKISTQINQTIIEKTTNYLLPAILISEMSVKFSESNVIDINNTNQIEDYLFAQIKTYPQLSKVYFGKENGDFIMLYRNEKKAFVSKIIEHQTKKEKLKEYNVFGDVTFQESRDTDYDPRTRAWYFDTKEKEIPVWTDLYMFYTGKRPGITASYPFFDKESKFQGAFGVDLELSEISEFLSFQKKYYNSKIIILNYKNEIVAQSGNVLFKTLKNGRVKPLHINEHKDSLIQEAYNKLINTKTKKDITNKQVVLNYNRKLYLVSSVDFPEYFGKNWKVMSILPREKLLENRIPSKIIFYIILIITTLIILIVSILISRSILKPIKQLSFDLQRLRYKNVDGKEIKSSILEINELIQIYTVIKKLYSNTFKK